MRWPLPVLRAADGAAVLRRHQLFWPVLLVASYALLAWYRFEMTTGAFRNSDDAGNFLAGVEMAEGNWLLSGWVMAPDNYYPTDVLGQAVLRLLFGFHPIFMMLWEGLVWGGVAWAGTWLACAGRPVRERPGILLIALSMLAFNVFDHAFADLFMSSIASHGCTILLMLATFAVVGMSSLRKAVCLALLGVLVTVGCFSDPTFNVIACLPVLAVMLLELGYAATRDEAAKAAGVTLGGMILARFLIWNIAQAGGFQSTHLSVALAGFPDLLTHLAFAAESITRLLGANFFGRTFDHTVTAGPAIQLIRTPLVVGLIISVCAASRALWRRARAWPAGTAARTDQYGTIDYLLLASTALCIASVCMTRVIVDQNCARFFLPAAVTGSVLVSRQLGRLPLVALYAGLVLPASIVFGIASLPPHQTPRSTIAIPQLAQIIDVLHKRGLQHGYAGYWESTIVTALAKRSLTSLPLSVGADGRLRVFHWLDNLDWYRTAARDWRGPVFFVAASQPGGLELSEADGRRQFGTPRNRIDLGQFVIDVFSTDDPGFHAPLQ